MRGGRLRVVGGSLRHRNLRTLPESRPTSQRAREALFDILGAWIVGRTVLELYAGSGAIAIEAISRGAREVLAVDRDAAALRANQAGIAPGLEVMEGPVAAAVARLRRHGKSFDLIFVDPPYLPDLGGAAEVAPAALAPLLARGGLLVWQMDARSIPDPGGPLEVVRVARYGRNVFHLYRARV
jgi:16S rRNA (guanine966-N2)-methyltransferase